MTAPSPLLPHLRARLPAFGTSDRKVAEAILRQPGDVVFWSVGELAEVAGTAKSSVVRFCQGIGLRGYHDLKLVLAQEVARAAGADDELGGDGWADGDGDGNEPGDVLGAVVRSGVLTLRDTAATVGRDAFDATAALLAHADAVLLVGSGASAPLAQDAAQRLRSIGLRAVAPADAPGQHVAAALLSRGGACLAISHRGETRGTLEAVAAAADAGAATAAITSFSGSRLTALVDHALVAGARPAAPRLAALTSRLAHLALLDALLVAVALRDQPRADAALARADAALAAHRR